MNKRRTGVIFIAIAALLFSSRYIGWAEYEEIELKKKSEFR